jgi:predicted ATP-binding protein involved in virulence
VERTISQHAIQPKTSKEHNLFEIYDSSFDSALSFEHFFQWFKDKSDLELQVREEETDKVIKLEKNLALQGMSYADWMNLLKKAREYEIPELQLVRQAIEYFFADFRNLRVNRNSPLRLELQKGDEILLVNQLSDGEKSVLTMIGDIARRLHLANPNMKDPLQGEGVVMIDEIELHLHPKWQQDILPKFRALFPNIQFIITTHSPHVISNVGENDLYQLVRRNGVLEVIPCVDNYGKKPQAILEDIQGLERLRPENIEKKFQQIYVQLDENDLESAKYSVQALQEQIGNDEELVKLRLLIRKKEILSP